MKNMLVKYYFLLLICLLVSCSANEKTTSAPTDVYAIATPNYAVLAEKAISYQADFNWESWANLLAEDVQFFLSDSIPPLVGKQAVLTYWKTYPQRRKLSSWQLSHLNHIPIESSQKLYISGMEGVHVFSMFKSQLTFLDGNSHVMNLTYCSHFNKKKLIDRCYMFYQPLFGNPTTKNYQ